MDDLQRLGALTHFRIRDRKSHHGLVEQLPLVLEFVHRFFVTVESQQRSSSRALDNFDHRIQRTCTLVLYKRLVVAPGDPQQLGAEPRGERREWIDLGQAMTSGAQAFLISPGPCTPNEAGISLDLVRACAAERRPLLGVCLGHQAIGQAFGGTVVRAGELMHGKTSPIVHDGTGVFAGLPSPITATRYHSLIVAEQGLPAELEINARVADGTIMGLRHRTLPIHGVQFHPESIATEHGHAMLANFMALAGIAVRERA